MPYARLLSILHAARGTSSSAGARPPHCQAWMRRCSFHGQLQGLHWLTMSEDGRTRAYLPSRQQEGTKGFASFLKERIFATHFSFTVSSLKMCTVSVLLEAERNMPSMLKAKQQMLTHLGRRRGRGGPPSQQLPQGFNSSGGEFLSRAHLGRLLSFIPLQPPSQTFSLREENVRKEILRTIR